MLSKYNVREFSGIYGGLFTAAQFAMIAQFSFIMRLMRTHARFAEQQKKKKHNFLPHFLAWLAVSLKSID